MWSAILNTSSWHLRLIGARSSSTAKRVVLPAPNTNLVFENVETANAASLQGRDVEVKVAACAVAYRDIIDRTGGFPFMNQPTVLGHEFSGVVTKVGGDTKNLSVGDKVVSLHWAQMDGEAFPSPFMHKESMQTFLGLTCDGGYQDYVSTHETAFVKVPNPHFFNGIEASPIMSTFGTVWQGAVVRGGLKENERILVTGASGGVGSAAVMMASRLGAYVIGTSGNVEANEDHIKSLGADECISAEKGFSKSLDPRNGGTGLVDMVIENVGAPTFDDSLRSLKPGGRLVLIGNVTNSSVKLPLGLCILKSLSVIGTDSIESHELKKLLLWLEAENLKPPIDRVMPLKDAAAAHDLVENRSVQGRIVLDVNNDDVWA